MRSAFILFFSFFLLGSINSCKQCSTCRKYPAADVKLCKKDFATDDSFSQAFHYQESLGYNCD